MKKVDKCTPMVHDGIVRTRTVTQYLCQRCGKWFTPRSDPGRCGKCKSPYWGVVRKGVLNAVK